MERPSPCQNALNKINIYPYAHQITVGQKWLWKLQTIVVMRKQKSLAFLLILLGLNAFGQSFEPELTQIDEQEGLPDQEVYAILQGEDGLFWLGTNSGLYSYDGRDFVHHRHERQKGTAIFNLNFDLAGNLWYNNLSDQVFCQSKDSIRIVKTIENKYNVGLKPVEKSNTGMLIFSDHFIVHHQAGEVDTIDYFSELFPCSNVINNDDYSLLWRNDTLFRIEGKHCEVVHGISGLPEYGGPVNLFDINGQVFIQILGEDRNYIFDITKPRLKERLDFKELEDKSIIRVVKEESSFWFLTGGGAYRYQYEKGIFVLKEHLLAGKTVTDIIKDQEGFLWMTTLNRGLYLLPYRECQRLALSKVEDRLISRMNHYQDSILYFISDRNSIHRLNVESKEYLKKDIRPFHNQYFAINPYSGDFLFFGGGLVKELDPQDLRLRRTAKHEVPKVLIPLGEKRYLGAYYYGARLWTKGFDNRYSKVIRTRTNSLTLAGNQKDLYIGFQDRMSFSDTSLQEEIPILIEQKNWTPNMMTAQPGSDIVWAVNKETLVKLQSGRVLSQMIPKEDLSGKPIQSIVADSNYLYIAYRNHIQALEFSSDSLFNFPYYPFLKQAVIREIQILKEWLLVNTGSGIFRLPKAHFKTVTDSQAIHLYLKTFAIDGKPQRIQNAYQLDQEANQIALRLSLNKVFPTDRFVYQYRWNGKLDWQSFPEGSDRLVLDNIPHGKNQLILRAKARQLNWSSEVIPLSLNRAFPWWRQWWFYGLMALGIGSFSFALVWFIERRKQRKLHSRLKRLQQDQEMVSLQLENLRSQMNPHFVFNALNSIQDYIVGNERRLASKFLVKFSRLIRLYLEHSRVPQINLEEELEALNLYLTLEKDRFDKRLNYDLEVDSSLPLSQIYIPSLLLQPYVENAVNHGLLHKEGHRRLHISFNRVADQLVCIIEDNGIGRLQAQKLSNRPHHKSFSTRANADRIALINRNLDQKLTVQVDDLYSPSGLASGTRVCIKIPMKYENYHN